MILPEVKIIYLYATINYNQVISLDRSRFVSAVREHWDYVYHDISQVLQICLINSR